LHKDVPAYCQLARLFFFADFAARHGFSCMQETQIIWSLGTVRILQQILPIVPASLYHIHLSTTEKAIVLFFMTLALMQPYIPHNWSIFPLFSISCFPACSELFMLRWHWLVNGDCDHRFDFCDACDEPNYRRAQRVMQEQAMLHREHITRVRTTSHLSKQNHTYKGGSGGLSRCGFDKLCHDKVTTREDTIYGTEDLLVTRLLRLTTWRLLISLTVSCRRWRITQLVGVMTLLIS
jgi:hypothetical protein